MTGKITGYTRNELLTMRNALIIYIVQGERLRPELSSGDRAKMDVAMKEAEAIKEDVLVALTERAASGLT